MWKKYYMQIHKPTIDNTNYTLIGAALIIGIIILASGLMVSL